MQRRVNLSKLAGSKATRVHHWSCDARTLTVEKKVENGRPLSRANAQVRRETEAKTPKSATIVEKRIMHMMMVAPALDSVAW